MSRLLQIVAGILVTVGLSMGAHADDSTVTFHAALSGAEEVPPNDTAGTGEAEFKLNTETKELSWTVTFGGLSGEAVAAHIHGPADRGANAGVVLNFGTVGQPANSPLMGTKTLTDAQIADLEAGKLYVNIHTIMYKGGEIRGQIMK